MKRVPVPAYTTRAGSGDAKGSNEQESKKIDRVRTYTYLARDLDVIPGLAVGDALLGHVPQEVR